MDRPPLPGFDWSRLSARRLRDLPLGEVGRIDDAASRPTDEQGGTAADALAQPAMGLEFVPALMRAVWGRVVGDVGSGTARYYWRPTWTQGDAHYDQDDDAPPGVALEAMGNADVPTDGTAVVPFWLSEDAVDGAAGECWRFVWPGDVGPVVRVPPGRLSGSGLPGSGLPGSGSPDCDLTFTGGGTICFDEVTLRVGRVDFRETSAYALVTNVCPVWGEIRAGAGVTVTDDGTVVTVTAGGPGGGSARVLRGVAVERRLVRLPAGLVVSDPDCRLDPADCCGSGPGGPGCCWPAPPATLHAIRYQSSAAGPCPPLCVVLAYDATADGWYSGDLGSLVGTGSDGLYLRLRCRDADYALDVVDGTTGSESEVLDGAPSADVAASCEPFVYAADFADDAGALCAPGDSWSYAVVEGDCTGDSGSGGGVLTDCCGAIAVPAALLASFAGALSSLGAVPLAYVPAASAWEGHAGGVCGIDLIRFECSSDGVTWEIDLGPAAGCPGGPATACSPFAWSCAGTAHVCAGAFDVSVRG